MRNIMVSKLRFQLMKEVDNLFNSPRKQQVTSSEFVSEMSRELGTEITLKKLESCVESLGWKISDVFKVKKHDSASTAMCERIAAMEQRVSALEAKLEGL
jgi:hypothetical protein